MNAKVMDKVSSSINTIIWKGKTLVRVTFQEVLAKFDNLKVSCPVSEDMADMILDLVPAYQTKDDGSVRSHDWDAIRAFQKGEESSLRTYIGRVASKDVTPRGQASQAKKAMTLAKDSGLTDEQIAQAIQAAIAKK